MDVVTSTRTVSEWQSGDEVSYLGCKHSGPCDELTLHIYLDEPPSTALIRLRLSIGVKQAPNKINLYFFIPIEHVASLERLSTDTVIPQPVYSSFVVSERCASSSDILAVRISLREPGFTIGPHSPSDLTPKTKDARHVLDRLCSLGQATQITLYLILRNVNIDQLSMLCRLVEQGRMRPMPNMLQRLYHGSGGRKIRWQATDTNSPPSYDEIGFDAPSLPKYRVGSQSNHHSPERPPKRKREAAARRGKELSTETSRRADVEEQVAGLNTQLDEIRGTVAALEERNKELEQANSRLTANLQQQQQQYMNIVTRLSALESRPDISVSLSAPHSPSPSTTSTSATVDITSDSALTPAAPLSALESRLISLFTARLAALRHDILEETSHGLDALNSSTRASLDIRIDDASARILDELRDTCATLRREFQGHLDNARDDMDSQTDRAIEEAESRWEDRFVDVKIDLEGFVREQMDDVEDRVEERVIEAVKDGFREGRASLFLDFE